MLDGSDGSDGASEAASTGTARGRPGAGWSSRLAGRRTAAERDVLGSGTRGAMGVGAAVAETPEATAAAKAWRDACALVAIAATLRAVASVAADTMRGLLAGWSSCSSVRRMARLSAVRFQNSASLSASTTRAAMGTTGACAAAPLTLCGAESLPGCTDSSAAPAWALASPVAE